VKRLCADDSAATSVKVGHRQAVIPKIPRLNEPGDFFMRNRFIARLVLRVVLRLARSIAAPSATAPPGEPP
jgi:hypothetical protein